MLTTLLPPDLPLTYIGLALIAAGAFLGCLTVAIRRLRDELGPKPRGEHRSPRHYAPRPVSTTTTYRSTHSVRSPR